MQHVAIDLGSKESQVCVRSAEQRQDAVARQVFDGSPVLLHDLAEVADRSADDLDDVFRVEFCPELTQPATSANRAVTARRPAAIGASRPTPGA